MPYPTTIVPVFGVNYAGQYRVIHPFRYGSLAGEPSPIPIPLDDATARGLLSNGVVWIVSLNVDPG